MFCHERFIYTAPRGNTAKSSAKRPLAARMRPQTLEEIAGQEHILGPGKLLRRAIEADRLSSLILYGPPGCGKTSLAEVIARSTRRAFDRTSGVLSNVAGLRQSLEAARQRRVVSARETILFIDEIHRFNKAQQDVLLPYVEEGAVTLIGATTHNPFSLSTIRWFRAVRFFNWSRSPRRLLKRCCNAPCKVRWVWPICRWYWRRTPPPIWPPFAKAMPAAL